MYSLSLKSERIVMVLTDRALLRLHVEAVWGVQLPPLAQNDLVLARTSFQPAWKLYAAELADGRVHIWRPDIDIKERNALCLQANEALAFPPVVAPRADISREVALSLAASPRINVDTVRNIARPLTVQDRPLVEVFQPASVDDYFHPQSRPLI